MKIILGAFLIAAISAIHYENNVTVDRHGRDFKKSTNLDINIEAVKAARVEEYNRYPNRYGYIRRHRHHRDTSSSCSDSKDVKKVEYKRFPQPEIKKVEEVKTLKVGDAQ